MSSLLGLALRQGARSSSGLHPSSWLVTRQLHSKIQLSYPIEEGVGDFLSPFALNTIAVDFQEGLLERLNDEVRGTELENKSVAQTVISTAGERDKILAFNYASLALNNSFFLESIKPPGRFKNHEEHICTTLGSTIRIQLGSLSQLKSNFSAAALGLVSSGWIWFVVDELGNLAILPTFGAGTLLTESRMQRSPFKPIVIGENKDAIRDSFQGRGDTLWTGPQRPLSRPSSHFLDGRASPPTSPISGASTPRYPFTPSTPSRSLLTFSGDDAALSSTPPGMFDDGLEPPPEQSSSSKSDFKITGTGKTLHPLFCVSVFEHAWLSAGYGVWGKEEYMRRFWNVVDWEKANRRYLLHTKQNPDLG